MKKFVRALTDLPIKRNQGCGEIMIGDTLIEKPLLIENAREEYAQPLLRISIFFPHDRIAHKIMKFFSRPRATRKSDDAECRRKIFFLIEIEKRRQEFPLREIPCRSEDDKNGWNVFFRTHRNK